VKDYNYKYENIYTGGGYLLEEYNDISSGNQLVRQNSFNRDASESSDSQVDTINYLNSVPYVINKETLHFVINE
jgi:hypothetical protein